jgi:hypothetical protein
MRLRALLSTHTTGLSRPPGHASVARRRRLGVSVPGINAWTRFKIDVNRAAARRIDAGRAMAEIVPEGSKAGPGGRKKAVRRADGYLTLKDLIGERARQRTNDWMRQTNLSEARLDDVFGDADRREVLVAEKTITR